MSAPDLDPIIPMSYVTACYRKALEPGEQARRIFSVVFEKAINTLLERRERRQQDPGSFNRALNDNLMLWEHLLAEVRNPRNPFPAEARAQILALGGFVKAHTKKVKQNLAPVDPLIAVNQDIHEGLVRADKLREEAIAKGNQEPGSVEMAL